MAPRLLIPLSERGDVLENRQGGEDDFDIAVEDAISERPAKREKSGAKGVSRSARDQKYGFGGATRRSKQNTRESTDNFDSSSGRGRGRGRGGFRGSGSGSRGGTGRGASSSGSKPRGGSKRLGKSRRQIARSKS
jgi:rRNA-processing protein EBP2